ncbi:MAG: antirestriction protein ArdA [Arachnia propionica]|uniref:antirestriction protein ArdA n=1 Tax=Arachnia propionica TaxID=1750 RepID=UPI002707BABE|nr:antirestriction protein ArdA [Arachnia propionica]
MTTARRPSPSLDVDGVPAAAEFDEANRGCWESFSEFVRSWADDCGMFHGWPEKAIIYFDWDAYERDCRYDYTVVSAPDGGVHVFRDC